MRRLWPLVMLACGFVDTSGWAAELKGKVVGVADKEVRIAVEGDLLPQVGDEVVLSFEIPGLQAVRVGTWKVSRIEGETVAATLVEATGTPAVDQLATIASPNPQTRPGPGSAPVQQPGPARVRYQGRVYETRYERQVEDGRPLDIYFFQTPPAGNVLAIANGEQLWNRFVRDPAVDHPDQSRFVWWSSVWEYQNGRWVQNATRGVTVEVLAGGDAVK